MNNYEQLIDGLGLWSEVISKNENLENIKESTKLFVKNKKDYLPLLGPAIKEFNESFNEN